MGRESLAGEALPGFGINHIDTDAAVDLEAGVAPLAHAPDSSSDGDT